jgi:hypothetical protein
MTCNGETPMIPKLPSSRQWRTGTLLAAALFASTLAAAAEPARPLLVLTSTNDANGNSVAVFELTGSDLTLAQTLPTGGIGGAAGNGGILQFKDGAGAVANFGSNTVSRLRRRDDSISVDGAINLSPDCVHRIPSRWPTIISLSSGRTVRRATRGPKATASLGLA